MQSSVPSTGVANARQEVHSTAEADALVKRLKQLEKENQSLTEILTKVCNENAKLSGTVAEMQEKYQEYSVNVFAETPILKALYDRDKFKLFGNSKSATPENMQNLLDNLCKEFVEYRAHHTSSNNEVQKLLVEVQQAHANVQKLSGVVRDQQEVMTCGPLAVSVHIVQEDNEVSNGALRDLRSEVERCRVREEEWREQLQRLQDELREKSAEVTRQQWELQVLRESGSSTGSADGEQQALRDKVDGYEKELEGLRRDLAMEVSKQKDVEAEKNALTVRLEELEDQMKRMADASTEGAQTTELPPPELCRSCEELHHQCEAAREEAAAFASQVAQLTEENCKLKDLSAEMEKEASRLCSARACDEERLSELSAQCEALARDVTDLRAERDQLCSERNAIQTELGETRVQAERVPLLEVDVDGLRREVAALRECLSSTELSEQALAKAKEEIARLEESERQSEEARDGALAQCAALEQSMLVVRAQLGETQLELQRVSNEKESLQATLDGQQQALESHEGEAAVLAREAAELRAEVSRLSEDNDKLRGLNTELEGQLNELQRRVEEIGVGSSIVRDLRSEVERCRVREEEWREQLQRLQDELREKSAEVTQQQWELQVLRESGSSTGSADGEQQALRDKVDGYEKELEGLRRDLAMEVSKQKDVEAEKNALTVRLEELEDQMKRMADASTEGAQTTELPPPELCRSCEELHHQCEAAREEAAAFASQVAQLTEENCKLKDLSAEMEKEASRLCSARACDEERLSELSAQCEALARDVTDLRAERDQLCSERNAIQTELGETRVQAERVPLLEVDVDGLRREVAALRECLSSTELSEQALAKAKEEIARLEESERQSEEARDGALAQCAALEQSMLVVRAQLGETQLELQRVSNEKESLQATLDGQQQALESHEGEAAVLAREAAELRAEVSRLSEDNDKLRGLNTELEGQLNELQRRVEEIGVGSSIVRDLRSEVERCRVREEEWREQLQRLQDELREKSAEVTQQQWELQVLRESGSSTGSADGEQQALRDKVDGYEKELEGLRRDLAMEVSKQKDVEAEKNALTVRLEELEDQMKRMADASTEGAQTTELPPPELCRSCEELHHQCEAAREEAAAFASQVAQLTEENCKLKDLSAEMEKEASRLCSARACDEERLSELSAQCEALARDVTDLRAERDQLCSERNAIQTELGETRVQAERVPLLEVDVDGLRREVAALRECLSSTELSEQALAKAKEEIARLEESERQSEEARDGALAQCAALEQSMLVVRAQLGETQLELQRVSNEKESLQATLDGQQQALESHEGEAAVLAREAAELRAEVSRLSEDNDKLRGLNTELEGQLNELQRRVEEIGVGSSIVRDLRSEVERCRVREEEWREQLQRLQDELREKSAEVTQQQWELQVLRESGSSTGSADGEQQALRDKVDGYEKELEGLRRDLAMEVSKQKDVEAEKNALTVRLEELEDQMKRMADASTEGAQTTELPPPELCRSCEELHHQCEAAREEAAAFASQVAQLTEENCKLKDLSAEMEKEASRLCSARACDEERLSELSAQCEALARDVTDLRAERDQLCSERNAIQTELGETRVQAERVPLLEVDVDGLRREVAALRECLSSTELSEQALAKAKEEIARLEESERQSEEARDGALAQCAALEQSMLVVRAQLGETQLELQRVSNEKESLQATLDGQQQALESHEGEAAVLAREAAELRAEVSRLSEDNDKLRGLNTELEGQLNELQRRVEDISRERGCAVSGGDAAVCSGVRPCLEAGVSIRGASSERAVTVDSEGSLVVSNDVQHVLQENRRLVEENQQMVIDIDRLTSELLVYRRNIDELEAENEEQLRQNEQIVSGHSVELEGIAARLAAETMRGAETSEKLEKLMEEYRLLEMEKVKYECLVEEKSKQEEKLLSTLVATSGELEAVKEELRRVMLSANDQLESMRREKELEMDMRIAQEREQHENESKILCAQLHQVEEERLLIESELDKLRLSAEGNRSVCETASAGNAEESDVAALRVQVNQLRTTLQEAHRQLEEHERISAETNEKVGEERKRFSDDAAAMQKRIEQLEEKLQTARSEQVVSGVATVSSKKKKRKAHNADLLSLVGFDNDHAVDIFTHATDPSSPNVGADPAAPHSAVVVEEVEDKLSSLVKENEKLKEDIANLTEQLQVERKHRNEDLEKQREVLDEKIQLLEQQLQGAAKPVPSPCVDEEKATCDGGAEQKVQLLTAENKRLRSKLRSAKEALQKKSGADDASAEQLREELQMLAAEIVPVKNKLVEYMAMADRIGIQYPFSEEMEKAALLHLNAHRAKKQHKKSQGTVVPKDAGGDEKTGDGGTRGRKKSSSRKTKERRPRNETEVAEDVR